MIMPRTILPILVVLILAMAPSDAEAQLFGNRSLGASSLSRRTRPGTTGAGEVTGNERFIRGNRSRRAFVGSDTQDVDSFVGSEQATVSGTMQSTTAGLRPPPDESTSINRPLPPRGANDLYYPRLVIDFRTPSPPRMAPDAISQRLQRSDSLNHVGQIEVSVADRTATLRGAVASESDRRLAALLASFEPGIDHVHNELVVDTSLSSPPAPTPADPPQPGPDFSPR